MFSQLNLNILFYYLYNFTHKLLFIHLVNFYFIEGFLSKGTIFIAHKIQFHFLGISKQVLFDSWIAWPKTHRNDKRRKLLAVLNSLWGNGRTCIHNFLKHPDRLICMVPMDLLDSLKIVLCNCKFQLVFFFFNFAQL